MRHVLPLLLFLTVGCGEPLAPGQWGTFRYFGQIPGEGSLRLLPPLSDRDGDVYVVYGARDRTDTTVYVGHHLGGWSGGCASHRGAFGVHGLIGRATDRAWIWSGDGLFAVSGVTGDCHEILANDPVSGTTLLFRAVVPWVDETPSHTTALALIQGATDRDPYHAVIDLDQDVYTNLEPFDPSDAEDLIVLGTGGSATLRRGVIVVAYRSGGGWRTEAIFLEPDGAIDARTTLSVEGDLTEFMILGFAQAADSGLWAAALDDGRLLVFNEEGGGTHGISGMTLGGLVVHDGDLWVTGTADGDAAVAHVDDDGHIDAPEAWLTAEAADDVLRGGIDVLDERSDPSVTRPWDSARSAMAPTTLVTPHPLDVYTLGSTGWLARGPGYDTGIEGMTAVAFAPVGLDVP